jgi:hypothetical protein
MTGHSEIFFDSAVPALVQEIAAQFGSEVLESWSFATPAVAYAFSVRRCHPQRKYVPRSKQDLPAFLAHTVEQTV